MAQVAGQGLGVLVRVLVSVPYPSLAPQVVADRSTPVARWETVREVVRQVAIAWEAVGLPFRVLVAVVVLGRVVPVAVLVGVPVPERVRLLQCLLSHDSRGSWLPEHHPDLLFLSLLLGRRDPLLRHRLTVRSRQ
jgi:hypothetical protein